MTARKRKDLSDVVNKEKDKGKHKTTTEDNGSRKRLYPPVLMCGAILTVNLGKTKAEKRKRLRKRTIQRLARMLGTSYILWLRMLVASVILSLFFVPTSAHGIEAPDLTNRFRILFHLRRYFTPSLPQRLPNDIQPMQHHSRF